MSTLPAEERTCICADPENCTERVPGYRCKKDFMPKGAEPVDIEKKALANLLDAVEGFLWFSWADSDLDADAAQAIDRLRLARDEYGTVQRIKNGQ